MNSESFESSVKLPRTMSSLSSPTRFDADSRFYELEEQVRVPLSMRMAGDMSPRRGEDEKLDMFVPDRILVVGQDQFFGTSAPPRELRLENSVRPPDPGTVRVETPPRVISLSEHRFPTVGEDDDFSEPESPVASLPNANIIMATPKKSQALMNLNDSEWTPISALNGSEMAPRGLQPGEEINHLRRQMAKLNRRLMAIELESIQRAQREKYLLAVGLGYYLMKFLFWLNK